MRDMIDQVKLLWQKLRSNPTFVAISGLFFGAVGDSVFEELQTGKLDLSRAGVHRILASAVGTAFVAWWHLHQPAPGQGQGQITPPPPQPPVQAQTNLPSASVPPHK